MTQFITAHIFWDVAVPDSLDLRRDLGLQLRSLGRLGPLLLLLPLPPPLVLLFGLPHLPHLREWEWELGNIVEIPLKVQLSLRSQKTIK